MNDIAIRCEGLGKRYRIGQRERYRALRDVLTNMMRSPGRLVSKAFKPPVPQNGNGNQTIWALRDVSFEVKRGEVLGVIGRNGSGKSTLLKILSRITKPTEGFAEVHGRVGSLLEVGTGFHPELTGRENIYLNGSILGMKKAEINRRFDEIVAFAGIEKFLDTPVKRYSTGMFVRLAFAVAAHLDTEILIVDEVLAVGDAAFQKKCVGKMGDVARAGRTILFVSHDLTAVQALCSRAVVLNSGYIFSLGPVDEQVQLYLSLDRRRSDVGPGAIALGQHLLLEDFHFTPNPIESGSKVQFSLNLLAAQPLEINDIAMLIYDAMGRRIAVIDLRQSGAPYELDGLSPVRINGEIESVPLVEGDYYVGLYVNSGEVLKDFYDLVHITVVSPREGSTSSYHVASRGVLVLDHSLFCETKLLEHEASSEVKAMAVR